MGKTGKYVIKWILIFFFGSVLSFLIIRALPTTPVDMLLEARKLERTEANIAMISRQLGMDRPLFVQYLIWLSAFLRGDWGTSLITGLDIRTTFLRKLPYSICIGLCGITFGAVTAFFLGYRSAIKPGRICDRLSSFLAVFSQSVPSFLITIVIIYFFSVKWKMVKFFTGDGKYALLAACCVSVLYTCGGLSRVVRAAFCEEMEKSYVKFSVSRGFSKNYVLFRHARRPVLCRLISTVIANFAFILGGSTILEFAFAIPGVSSFLVSSMNGRDYTVMQSYIMVVILWMFLVHVILNLVLWLLDVRRRK